MTRSKSSNPANYLADILREKSAHETRTIAYRLAMRVLPISLAVMQDDRFLPVNFVPLSLLRICLTSGANCKDGNDYIGFDVSERAPKRVSAPPNDIPRTPNRGAYSGHGVQHADWLIFNLPDVSRPEQLGRLGSYASMASALTLNPSAAAGNADRTGITWPAVEHDLSELAMGQDIISQPLWPSPNPLDHEWEASQTFLRQVPGGDFWIDWYQRALDGRPQNWPLLRAVALIDNALWEQGGEALDREIRRLVEQHHLLAEVRRLKVELAAARSADAAVAHRGHNNPPELLPMQSAQLASAADRIVQALDDVEQELEQTDPSPGRLRQIADRLATAAKTVLLYCGKLGDMALQGFAKDVGSSIGKWAGPAVITYLAAQGDEIGKIADAISKFADKL